MYEYHISQYYVKGKSQASNNFFICDFFLTTILLHAIKVYPVFQVNYLLATRKGGFRQYAV
ncbi:MAG: hypothetical protein A2X54_10200 [Nitrospirae bacterium GWF2_44_13]|nr:MAG: hypothetical protein A2X54_10200 [Nitrospirae bacterium GWF2_44_13]OGW33701.1 MAG: hypothetical protein A2088_01405 [Nitrospirae bacterium GWD2_44_7]OGW66036.1 MAG: hypothetical protein A2222_09145 [Nitrospirae bacterium RIFOXYA2_FULL_44_9]